ncbi:MAG: hypothetical protein EOP62_11670 [Sphingomonadales bacterium]|nr:MAG: hypothetical protein EOP62_11670 [Sphingomonadales bacterium]
MFVATADRNYLLARIAHLHALDTDFWWLSMHALEKYLKAILLLNGHSAKNAGHDLVKLVAVVRALDKKINFGPFADPQITNLHWRASSVEAFLLRLNEYGSAQNRYLTYGHTASLDDLVKVDQLVWSVRRHCIPFKIELGEPGHERTFDRLQELVAQPDRWRLGGTLPIEQVMGRPETDGLHNSLMRLNTAFNPDGDLRVDGWRVSASNPPLAQWFDRLRSPNASKDTRDTSAEVLQWSLDNVYFGKPDRLIIERELLDAGYAPPSPPAPAPAPPAIPAAVGSGPASSGPRVGAKARAVLTQLWRTLRNGRNGGGRHG